jgi:hypothetical protein
MYLFCEMCLALTDALKDAAHELEESTSQMTNLALREMTFCSIERYSKCNVDETGARRPESN